MEDRLGAPSGQDATIPHFFSTSGPRFLISFVVPSLSASSSAGDLGPYIPFAHCFLSSHLFKGLAPALLPLSASTAYEHMGMPLMARPLAITTHFCPFDNWPCCHHLFILNQTCLVKIHRSSPARSKSRCPVLPHSLSATLDAVRHPVSKSVGP